MIGLVRNASGLWSLNRAHLQSLVEQPSLHLNNLSQQPLNKPGKATFGLWNGPAFVAGQQSPVEHGLYAEVGQGVAHGAGQASWTHT